MAKDYRFLLEITVYAPNYDTAENLLFANIKSKLKSEEYGLTFIKEYK